MPPAGAIGSRPPASAKRRSGGSLKFRVHTRADIDRIPELQTLSERDRLAMKAVSAVLPFRVNRYVIENLIDWSRIPDDPTFQLTFPQPGRPATLIAPTAATGRNSSVMTRSSSRAASRTRWFRISARTPRCRAS